MDILLKDFDTAARLIRDKGLTTPLIPFALPHANPILLKAENLQPSGSFKIRGATYCLSLLSPEQRTAGVVAYSTGNHAQAVALAAKLLGIKATIVMSAAPIVPQHKIDATKAYGADVVIADPTSDARRKVAEQLAQSQGYYLVPPYDHGAVMTGQGTIGIEILDAVDPAAVIVPIGGGGLIAGIAMAIKKRNPAVKIIGVEPELENDAFQSFKTGKRVALSSASSSIADAIKVQTLGDLTWPLIQKYVDDVVVVSEDEIKQAMLICAQHAHLIAEPAGALAIAVAVKGQLLLPPGKPIVCIISGGNVQLSTLCQFI